MEIARAAVEDRVQKMTSGGKEITVEVFVPNQVGKYPVVVLLHGADGLQFDHLTATYRRLARDLAGRGFVVVFPHYFERTDSKFGDLGAILTNYPAWFETASDAIAYASALPEVDPDRLALAGVSLGGTLAIDTAAKDPRVKVLVDYFGGFPESMADWVEKLPPTIVLHGAKDPLVSPKSSEKLAAVLAKLKVEHELKIYPDQGHGFEGADERDALERTVRFLDVYLPPAK